VVSKADTDLIETMGDAISTLVFGVYVDYCHVSRESMNVIVVTSGGCSIPTSEISKIL
jgi:hypothetical protein